MRMTAAQMSAFALESAGLLDPLLTPEMRNHPAWASWLKLVELFALVTLHTLHRNQIQEIDKLQLEHSALFDAVYEYRGLKRPKHHSLVHLANEVWRFGPARGYQCFGFEHVNSVIRLGAKHSNLGNEAEGIAAYWSMRMARALQPGGHF